MRSMVSSRPPGTTPVRTSTLRPSRAAVRPAVSPATPPPATTMSYSSRTQLAPGVDRDRCVLALVRPELRAHRRAHEDAEVTVRLAAGDDDVDAVRLEDRDRLLRACGPVTRERLDACLDDLVDEVEHDVVPVAAARD